MKPTSGSFFVEVLKTDSNNSAEILRKIDQLRTVKKIKQI